ncbi:MAG TPA: GlsB/YeaQ/YmgE family stress response membrane protein [Candidatus Angelobacter sp.]|nr:GlsB/YeaQ/YmgE family stress response membrane protein [Candidatus Angelobacter sp.]
MTGKVICWIILGVIAGLLSRRIIKGQGYGMLADVLLGIMGAAVGGWSAKSFSTSILTAVVGALVMIWLSTRPAKRISQKDGTINQRLSQ